MKHYYTTGKLNLMALALLSFLFLLNEGLAQRVSQTFNGGGSISIPAGATNIVMEAWGGGGQGNNSPTGGGGGGGAYAGTTIPGPLASQMTYNIRVGSGGVSGGFGGGGNSDVRSAVGGSTIVLARGGLGGGSSTGGVGGAMTGIGTQFRGGNGGSAVGTKGGNGGGSATSTGNGGNGGVGSIVGIGEGNGGVVGRSGNPPGGGGGALSNGANGRIIISYDPPALTGVAATMEITGIPTIGLYINQLVTIDVCFLDVNGDPATTGLMTPSLAQLTNGTSVTISAATQGSGSSAHCYSFDVTPTVGTSAQLEATATGFSAVQSSVLNIAPLGTAVRFEIEGIPPLGFCLNGNHGLSVCYYDVNGNPATSGIPNFPNPTVSQTVGASSVAILGPSLSFNQHCRPFTLIIMSGSQVSFTVTDPNLGTQTTGLIPIIIPVILPDIARTVNSSTTTPNVIQDLDALIPGSNDTYYYSVSSSDPTNVSAGQDRILAMQSADPISDTYTNPTNSDVIITYAITPHNGSCFLDPFDLAITVKASPETQRLYFGSSGSQSITIPAGARNIVIRGWGGGGGGNNVLGVDGGGGGAGGFAKKTLTGPLLSPLPLTVNVGAGGAAGSNGANTEVKDGSTDILLARAGLRGNNNSGGAGGANGIGDITTDGGAGGQGDSDGSTVAGGGGGGSGLDSGNGGVGEDGAIIVNFGSRAVGGAGGIGAGNGGNGGHNYFSFITNIQSGAPGNAPGGGGGSIGGSSTAGAGADGAVEILWEESEVQDQTTTVCSGVPMNFDLDAVMPGTTETYTYTVASTDVTPAANRTVASDASITDSYVNNTGSDATVIYTIIPIDGNGKARSSFTLTVTIRIPANSVTVTGTNSGTYCSIQEALDAAATGDKIVIPAGTYNDCIIVSEDVNMEATGGPVILTCLTMDGTGKTMTLDADLTITTLTLTDGNIKTNGNNLKTSTISGGSSSSYVITD
ncbi:MAG: PKD-like domain-containing protein [Bacteroidia bacterium]